MGKSVQLHNYSPTISERIHLTTSMSQYYSLSNLQLTWFVKLSQNIVDAPPIPPLKQVNPRQESGQLIVCSLLDTIDSLKVQHPDTNIELWIFQRSRRVRLATLSNTILWNRRETTSPNRLEKESGNGVANRQTQHQTSTGSTWVSGLQQHHQSTTSRLKRLSDFRIQGCDLINAILDLKLPPTGRLALENIYIMLSRINRWENLAILRPFEDSVLGGIPDEQLDEYDEFLKQMHIDTKRRTDIWR